MKFLLQAAVLILSFAIVFFWHNFPLADLTVPLLGILIVIYLILSFRKGGKGFLQGIHGSAGLNNATDVRGVRLDLAVGGAHVWLAAIREGLRLV